VIHVNNNTVVTLKIKIKINKYCGRRTSKKFLVGELLCNVDVQYWLRVWIGPHAIIYNGDLFDAPVYL
jgi:hypothetical protein